MIIFENSMTPTNGEPTGPRRWESAGVLAGTPTHELQRLGGSKTGVMVERYAHIAPETPQHAAESARCDRQLRFCYAAKENGLDLSA